MATDFSRTLSLLRQETGVSQRKAAAALGVSQALLSHYENGIREPGLAFVSRVCDYYHVSADFLLGRSASRDGSMIDSEELYDGSAEKGSETIWCADVGDTDLTAGTVVNTDEFLAANAKAKAEAEAAAAEAAEATEE